MKCFQRQSHIPSWPTWVKRCARGITLGLVLLAGLSTPLWGQSNLEVALGSVSVFNDGIAEVPLHIVGNGESRGLQVRLDFDSSNITSVDLGDCLEGFVGVGQLGTMCSQPDGAPGRIRIILNAGPGQAINDFSATLRFQLDGTLPAGATIPLQWDSPFAAATTPNAGLSQSNGLITSDGPPPGELALVPGSIDFGQVEFGQTDQALVTVSNAAAPGAQNLVLETIGVSGDAGYSITSGGSCSLGAILEPQAEGCTIEVAFQPPGVGQFDGVLTVTTADEQTQQTQLSGTGIPAPATVSFADLVQVFTGSPLAPSVTTDPEGLSVVITFDGEPDAPINAGTYLVVATIDDPNFVGSASATFEIERAEAVISLTDLVQTFTGEPLSPTISTDPEGLSVAITFDGDPDAPTNAGTYTVVADIDDPNFTGSASETFEILRAEAVISFADLVQLFTGEPLTPTIETEPEGLNIVVTFNDDPDPPSEIGIYLVEVLIEDPNFTGWNSALFRIVGDEMFRDRFERQELQPGTVFHDCDECPTMVVIPAGSFTQGSLESEPQSSPNERPQREVSVPAFAMGRTAVTFAEWDACVADGGCTHNPGDFGWGRANRPVINVSWNDAQQYVTWLSNKTGHDYRLPSESEWEYATRAGTTGRFNTGDCITTDQANFHGGFPATGCPTGILRNQTLPVGSFSPNAFGLYDTHGNTWEWVQDCWNASYNGAPTNGSAWMSGDCSLAVLRGGSWGGAGGGLRSAARHRDTRGDRFIDVGFRVARSVEL